MSYPQNFPGNMNVPTIVTQATQSAQARTRAIARQAGGAEKGAALLAGFGSGAVSDDPSQASGAGTQRHFQWGPPAQLHYGVERCMEDPTTRAQCLKAQMNDACCIEKNGPKCAYISRLYGATLHDAVAQQLTNSKYSDIENYFYPPTDIIYPKYTTKDIAAVAIASANTIKY